MTQSSLFPETSLAARDSVVHDLSERQRSVLRILRFAGPLTLEELVRKYRQLVFTHPETYVPQSDSGIRTRCAELVDQGQVRDSGKRARTSSGRKAIVWEAAA